MTARIAFHVEGEPVPQGSTSAFKRGASAITERDFQRQVTDLALLFGWSWVHFRPAQTAKGWRTPVEGPLGKGWPDLLLARGSRLIFVELKRDRMRPTEDQEYVLAVLGEATEAYVWHPADFDAIAVALR